MLFRFIKPSLCTLAKMNGNGIFYHNAFKNVSICFSTTSAMSRRGSKVLQTGTRYMEPSESGGEYAKIETAPRSHVDLSHGDLPLNKNNDELKNNRIEYDKNDKLFFKIAHVQKNKKQRKNGQKMLLEGASLIQSALNHGVKLEYLFYSKKDALLSLSNPNVPDERILQVKDKTLRTLSDTRSLCQVVAVCPIPTLQPAQSNLPVTILCSDIRDPDNLGSMISAAAATGCKSVLLTSGCADAWDHKVLNSAGGAHFCIPITTDIKWPELSNNLPEDFAFYIADSSTDIDIQDSQVYYDDGNGNLLNVIDADHTTLLGDKQEHESLSNDNMNMLQGNENFIRTSENQLQDYENYEMPCHLYFNVMYPKKDIVIYMGGETVGVNKNFEELGNKLRGTKIKLPLENGMDSMNVSSALGVILFEIKRQFEKQESYI